MKYSNDMQYIVKLTYAAEQDIDDNLEYLARNCSIQAYNAVKDDMNNIIDIISDNPYLFCEYEKDPTQRSAHLKKHQYKFIYFVKDIYVYITAFLHDLNK